MVRDLLRDPVSILLGYGRELRRRKVPFPFLFPFFRPRRPSFTTLTYRPEEVDTCPWQVEEGQKEQVLLLESVPA